MKGGGRARDSKRRRVEDTETALAEAPGTSSQSLHPGTLPQSPHPPPEEVDAGEDAASLARASAQAEAATHDSSVCGPTAQVRRLNRGHVRTF